MLESDSRLYSFESVDRARSVLADATSLAALTHVSDEVLRYGPLPPLQNAPALANTIQSLIVHEFIYGDFLLFDEHEGFKTAENLFPGVVRRLFVHPDLRREIADDMGKLRNQILFCWTSELNNSQVERLLNLEEAGEKPLLDKLCTLPAVTRVPPDLVDDGRLERWASAELRAKFPLGVLTSSNTVERAFWYLRFAQEAGLPLVASPARSLYFKMLVDEIKTNLVNSEANRILSMFDEIVVTAEMLKKWRHDGIVVDKIKIPAVAEYVVRHAREKQISLVDAIRDVRASPQACEFRNVCGDMQALLLDGSTAALLARERALRKLRDLGCRWAENLGPKTGNQVRTYSLCVLAKGVAEVLPYFGIIGAGSLISNLTAQLRELGLDRVKLRLPWTRRGLPGEMFLSDVYTAPDPL